MKILKNELKSELNIRTEKDFPKKGIEFIDIMPLIIQKETFSEIIEKFAQEIQNKKVDYIVGPEARGLIIGAAISAAVLAALPAVIILAVILGLLFILAIILLICNIKKDKKHRCKCCC